MKLVKKEPLSDNLEELRIIDEETEKVKEMSKQKEKDQKQKETGTKKGKRKKNRDRDTKFVIPTPAEHEKAIYKEDKLLKQKDPDVRPKEKKNREPAGVGVRHADPTTSKQKDPDVRPKEKKYREPAGEGLRHADPLSDDEDIYGLPSASGLGGDRAASSDSGWFWVPLGEGGPPGVEPSGAIRQFHRYPKPSDAEELDPLDVDAKFQTMKYRALGRRSDIRHNYSNMKVKQKKILDEILFLHQQVQIENLRELKAYDKKEKLQATNEMVRLSKIIYRLNNEYQEIHEEQWDLESCVRLCDKSPGKAMQYLGIRLPAPPMLLPVEEEPPPPPPPQPTFAQAMGNLVLSHMERQSHMESPFRASDPIGGPVGVAFRTTPARSTAFPDLRVDDDFWISAGSGSKRNDSDSPPGSPGIGGAGGASAGPAPAPRPPTPPPQGDPRLRMPYGHILPSDQAWSRFSNN